MGFLFTRVKAPTEEYQQKLHRVLGYLAKTKEFKCKLEPKGMFDVQAYMNVCFAMHEDLK